MTWRGAVATLGLALTLIVIGVVSQQKSPITVVIDVPFYNPAIFDPSELDAARLFLEDFPNTRIEIQERFYSLEPASGRALFEQALESGETFFITTQPSQSLLASADLFSDSSRLLLNTSATSFQLSGLDDGIVRIIPDLEQEQSFIANTVAAFAPQRILVLMDAANSAYTEPAFTHFAAALASQGDWQVMSQSVWFRDLELEDLAPLFDQEIDLLYILAGDFQSRIGNVMQYFHHLHPSSPIVLTPWARSNAVYQTAGAAIEQTYLISHYDSRRSDPALDSYIHAFIERFGYKPHDMAMKVRQALELLHHAIVQGHDTPQAVKDYLLSQSVHQTSLGAIRFDSHGDVLSSFFVISAFDSELP